MYIQGMAQQTQIFLLCIGFGFVMGLFYDVFCMVRKIFFTSRVSVYFQDIIYFLICTVAAFFFLLCVNGLDLRMYVLVGMGVGFAVYYFTLGIIISKLCNAVAVRVHKVLRPLLNAIKKIFSLFINKIKEIVKKITKKSNKTSLNT